MRTTGSAGQKQNVLLQGQNYLVAVLVSYRIGVVLTGEGATSIIGAGAGSKLSLIVPKLLDSPG